MQRRAGRLSECTESGCYPTVAAGRPVNSWKRDYRVLKQVRWWAGPLLLATIALAFDAADRRIPFGVWTTGPVDEVAHLCTAALGLLVLARFSAAPLLRDHSGTAEFPI